MQLASLRASYQRRQEFLAKLQAIEIAKTLFGSKSGSGSSGTGSGQRHREVSLDGLMAAMGTKWA